MRISIKGCKWTVDRFSYDTKNLSEAAAISVLALSRLLAQDAKIVADNIEFRPRLLFRCSFLAIAESASSFGYQRYPDNGRSAFKCDSGTFARHTMASVVEIGELGRDGSACR